MKKQLSVALVLALLFVGCSSDGCGKKPRGAPRGVQREIPISFPGELTVNDFGTVYHGRHAFLPHQFGFVRVNVDTGEVIWKVGIGYCNDVHPPSSIGECVVGDQNQTVTVLTANDDWIVTDNLGNTDFRPLPAALVWKNDATVSFHGYLPKQSGYWWERGTEPRLLGDYLYVKNDRDGWDQADVRAKMWVAANVTPPEAPTQDSIDGYTFKSVMTNPPHADKYLFVRSDVQGPTPAPQPTSEPPGPPATVPPYTTFIPVPTSPPSAPCPLGYMEHWGRCYTCDGLMEIPCPGAPPPVVATVKPTRPPIVFPTWPPTAEPTAKPTKPPVTFPPVPTPELEATALPPPEPVETASGPPATDMSPTEIVSVIATETPYLPPAPPPKPPKKPGGSCGLLVLGAFGGLAGLLLLFRPW